MTFPAEVEAGAQVAYRSRHKYAKAWKILTQEQRDSECQAFAAGLRALLPASDAVLTAMLIAKKPRRPSVAQALSAEFTAVITYLTSEKT